MTLTSGVDVGTSAVKCAVLSVEEDETRILSCDTERIRRRDLRAVIHECYDRCLGLANVKPHELDYVATTGEADEVDFRTGHFYSMTAHARGALFLHPTARGAIDLGALHTRAIKMDERGKVLQYQMTSQCASGSGQFVENIVRYLGVSLDEVGELSKQADNPEMVSSICAVLSETDVINMVSRGISAPNILEGIHLSIASRLVKLVNAIKLEGESVLTGGMGQDAGLARTFTRLLEKSKASIEVVTHPQAVFAGAIGAALWGAFRHARLAATRKEPCP
jgi:benzoyl-CoA reductase subunit D